MIPKFRAWKINNTPEMFTDIAYIDFNKREIGINYTISKQVVRLDREPMDNVILLQYTGHIDKHDSEIYEKDLASDGYGRIYQVVFKGDCWRCETVKGGAKNRWISNDLEVIGNIYENSDLLN